jgi:uncharacterized protein (DUF885 family)
MQGRSEHECASISAASGIVDAAWAELQRSPFVKQQLGLSSEHLADVSLGEAERRSGVGRSLLKRLESLDTSVLSHDVLLTLRLVRYRADTWAREADWYWTVIEGGFFGMFLPTAYCGGSLLNSANDQLTSCTFLESVDADRYLALVADYARLVDQFSARTAGQAERGMRMPKTQVQPARELLAAFKARARAVIEVEPGRLRALPKSDFARHLDTLITTCVEPAFDRAIELLSDEYYAKAPDGVGLGQYRGGSDLYCELARFHTTLDLTPEEIHAIGHSRMTDIELQMRAIRSELGFEDNPVGFAAHLNEDARWRTDSVDGVRSVFEGYLDRWKPCFDDYFPVAPQAACGIAPLPVALQDSMTYGYYDPPRGDRPTGVYFFNAKNLTKQALFMLGALIFHELIPGHHLHFATQQENASLHPFRKFNFVNAYNEGWAEYAASLAGELGLYEHAAERYGRLAWDAFLTCRLVVDTGMNALGWSLERARQYMRKHSSASELEILTESVRYACDIPGQALAYKLGEVELLGMRQRMCQALGPTFNVKRFHAAVLGPGALPLPDLSWHVNCETQRWVAET